MKYKNFIPFHCERKNTIIDASVNQWRCFEVVFQFHDNTVSVHVMTCIQEILYKLKQTAPKQQSYNTCNTYY